MKIAPLFVLSSFLISGCATVRSTSLDSKPAFDANAKGLTYFLPSRFVKLTATRELLDPASLKVILDAKTKELEIAKSAATTADEAVKAKADILAKLPADAKPETKIEATVAVEIATAEAAVAAAQKDALAATVAGLKKMLIAAQTSPSNACGYSVKLELLAAQPDPAARFVVRPVHNPLRDDSTKLVVTPDGLLSSANVVAADRTGDIIVELAGAIAGIGSGGVGAAEQGGDVIKCDQLPKKFIRIFDPAVASQNPTADLQKARFPIIVGITNADTTAVTEPSRDWQAAQKPNTSASIFYRSAVPLRVRVSECLNGELQCGIASANVLEEALVMIPQAGPISYIPQRSSAFVKTVNDVQFENGLIKSWNADRPSEVLEIVRLPVRVLTAIVSVPASLIQLRVNYNSQSKGLADAQAGEILATTKLRALQTCLLKAGDDPVASKVCLAQ